MRKTKIVATVGPSANDLETITALIRAGVSVFRFNFSHDDHQAHDHRIALVKQAAKDLGVTVGLMLDTKGAEIRSGVIENDGRFTYQPGDEITLTMAQGGFCTKTQNDLSYAGLSTDVSLGSHILFDDGTLDTVVTEKDAVKNQLVVQVQNAGSLGSRKGVNVPGVHLRLAGVTQKDQDDIRFGLERGINYIAASFVNSAQDVEQLRDFVDAHGGQDVLIIPKIESQAGLDHANEILAAADGLMVARGDLGVEIPYQKVPAAEALLIEKANLAAKPVITATQMLDSMTENPRPTRAEVTDITWAVLEGSDATMLSGETAGGQYPVKSVQAMAAVAEEADTMRPGHADFMEKLPLGTSITSTTAIAAVTAAERVKAKAILTMTKGGTTAHQISRLKPKAPIIAVTFRERVAQMLQLSWGVTPVVAPQEADFAAAVKIGETQMLQLGIVKPGDVVVLVASLPFGQAKSTNTIMLRHIGED